ncbi:hypothetical protein U1Q18_005051 [Sarracenia purpurea var. burkii]
MASVAASDGLECCWLGVWCFSTFAGLCFSSLGVVWAYIAVVGEDYLVDRSVSELGSVLFSSFSFEFLFLPSGVIKLVGGQVARVLVSWQCVRGACLWEVCGLASARAFAACCYAVARALLLDDSKMLIFAALMPMVYARIRAIARALVSHGLQVFKGKSLADTSRSSCSSSPNVSTTGSPIFPAKATSFSTTGIGSAPINSHLLTASAIGMGSALANSHLLTASVIGMGSTVANSHLVTASATKPGKGDPRVVNSRHLFTETPHMVSEGIPTQVDIPIKKSTS